MNANIGIAILIALVMNTNKNIAFKDIVSITVSNWAEYR